MRRTGGVRQYDASPAAVHEIELVLLFVEVEKAFEAGREHDTVDAEGGHAERAAHLAEARPLAELVQRSERVTAHSLRIMASASSRVKARNVSVCSAPYWLSFIRISIATSSSGASKISTTS